MTTTTNLTLFEIGDEMQALNAILDEIGGDVTDEEADATIDRWIKENEKHLDQKLEDYGKLIRYREMMAAWRKSERERLAALEKTDNGTIDRLKKRLLNFFQFQNIKAKETPSFKFTRAGNGGKRALKILGDVIRHLDFPGPNVDPDLVPAKYRSTVKITILDLDKVRADLEECERLQALFEQAVITEEQFNKQVAGYWTAMEVARLEPRGEHIRVK